MAKFFCVRRTMMVPVVQAGFDITIVVGNYAHYSILFLATSPGSPVTRRSAMFHKLCRILQL